jgi:perosamine synthetase
MYASGRSAIHHAVKSLNLPPESVFLLPAFHCGVEVEAIIRAGCQVDFYQVKRDLSIDFQNLAGMFNAQTAGVLIIHYFGFPQELSAVKKLCAQNGSVLLEDCAHALYSRNPDGELLGTIGDYGIFSLQKTIALPNGGGLLVNAPAGKKAKKGNTYYDHSLLKGLIRSSLEFENQQGGLIGSFAGKLLSFYSSMTGGQSIESAQRGADAVDMRWYYDVPRYGYENDISLLSIPFVGKEPFEHIISRRRSNYQILETLLEKAGMSDLLICRLLEGCCPLCLPVSVNRRDEVVTKMKSLGVEPFVFGRFPHPLLDRDSYPYACFLSDTIIGLPVQQQLDSDEMGHVADVFCSSLLKA